MTLDTVLRLGRISNLPTVWTNALAGGVLAVGAAAGGPVLLAAVALSLLYVGGMWLNDAFDAEIDARERASRPIPRGEIARTTVFATGSALLAAGVGLAATAGFEAALAGLALAAAIVLYDWLHKRTALSPVIMGSARALSYILAASVAGAAGHGVVAAALGLMAYVAGLTYAAKQEAYDRLGRLWPLMVLGLPVLLLLWLAWGALWPMLLTAALVAVIALAVSRLVRRRPGDVPRAVVTLIAGICLYDAVLIAVFGTAPLSLLAVAGFAATLALQRVAPGT